MRDERGSAVVLALLAMVLLGGLGAALVVGADVETRVSANYRDGVAALYAAEGAMELAVTDLLGVPDWLVLLEELPRALGNPAWCVYLEAPWHDLFPSVNGRSDLQVNVWIAEDPSAPAERLLIAGVASGRGGIRRIVRATLVRTTVAGTPQARIVQWREVRQGLE